MSSGLSRYPEGRDFASFHWILGPLFVSADKAIFRNWAFGKAQLDIWFMMPERKNTWGLQPVWWLIIILQAFQIIGVLSLMRHGQE